MYYICLECEKIIPFTKLLRIVTANRLLKKCPYCRGKVRKVRKIPSKETSGLESRWQV